MVPQTKKKKFKWERHAQETIKIIQATFELL